MYFTKLIFILLLSIGLFAVQNQLTLAQNLATVNRFQQPITAEAVSQNGNPLLISVKSVGNTDADFQIVYYSIQNISPKPVYVFSYAETIAGVTQSSSSDLPMRIFQPQEIRYEEYKIKRTKLKPDSKLLLSIDYVLFTDGSSWGEDKNKTLDGMVQFLIGRKAGVDYFRKIVENNDLETLAKLLSQDFTLLQMSVPSAKMSEQAKISYRGGFKSVYYVLKKVQLRDTETILKSLNQMLDELHLQYLENL